MSDGLVIRVQSGSNLAFSLVKNITDSGKGRTAALATSLREAQVEVNQFLTELVEKSDNQGQSQGLKEESSGDDDDDDDDDEEEEEEEGKNIDVSEIASSAKRKKNVSKSDSSTIISDLPEKRIKSKNS